MGSLFKLAMSNKDRSGDGVLTRRQGVDYIIPICVTGDTSYYWNLMSALFDHNTLAKIGKLRGPPTAMPGPRLEESGSLLKAAQAFGRPLVGTWIVTLIASFFSYGLLSWWVLFLAGMVPVGYNTHSYWSGLDEQNFKFSRDLARAATMVPPQGASGTVIIAPPIKFDNIRIPVVDYDEGKAVRKTAVKKFAKQIFNCFKFVFEK